jgi:polyamine oxidase
VCAFRCSGGLYDEAYVQKIIDRADAVESKGEKLSASLPASGSDDISILAMQRLYDQYVVLYVFFFVFL